MSNVKGPDEAQNPDFEELVAQYQGSVLRIGYNSRESSTMKLAKRTLLM